MSHHVEAIALLHHDRSVVLSAFQDSKHFTSGTSRRYTGLVDRCALIGVLGAGMPATPVAGVRGADIVDGHALRDEWTVAVVGPHHAAALIARDCGDQGPDQDRRFEYVITHERDLVIAAARSLMTHLEPTMPATADRA